MHDRHGDEPMFSYPNWETLKAPVVPPSSVVKQLEISHQPVEWENGEMFYRTEYNGDEIVTRLRLGSAQPIRGWLR